MKINSLTNLKKCSSCKEDKPAEHYNANKALPDGLHNQCKPCKKTSWRSPESIARGKKKSTDRNRFKWSGFTPEEFNSKLEEQGNKCGICGTDDPGKANWHADHNHNTFQKRGILCRKCNTAIAYLQEDPEIMQKAIYYIQHYSR